MLAPGRLTGTAGPVNARGGKGLCRLVTGLCSWRNSTRNQLTRRQRGGSTELGVRRPEGCPRSSPVSTLDAAALRSCARWRECSQTLLLFLLVSQV